MRDHCECGHPLIAHDDLGTCFAILWTEPSQPYCGCLEYMPVDPLDRLRQGAPTEDEDA